jgi:hypothetical protein
MIQREALTPNTPACWGLRGAEEMASYSGARPTALRKEVLRRGIRGLTVLRLHAVTHVVVLSEQLPWPEVEPLEASGAIVLARLRGAPHWAAVYPSAHVVADAAAALERVLVPGFAPDRECVIELDGAAPRESGAAGPPARAREGRTLTDRVELVVESPRDGAWLVVRDGFSPGWTATVDGAPTPVRAADLVFRAVEVPRGRHEVGFTYEAPGRRAGAWVSALTWLVALAAGALEWRARRQLPTSASACQRPL